MKNRLRIIPQPIFCLKQSCSVNIFVNGSVKLFDEGIVAGLDSVTYAVLEVIFEYNARSAAQRRTDGCQLYKNVGAVTLILDHALYRFEMPDSAREPVYHGLALSVGVRMIVMRMLMLLVLAYVVARLGLMAVDYTVSVIVVKSLVWSVH